MLALTRLLSITALRTEEVLRRQTLRRAPAVAGNTVAAIVASAGAAGVVAGVAQPAAYMAFSVAGYCLRRGVLHKWPCGAPLGAAEVLRRHLEYEADWHEPGGSPLRGRLLHLGHVACWLLLFQPACTPVLDRMAVALVR